MSRTERYAGELGSAIDALESYLKAAGTTVVQAAFEHSFFIDPEAVRARTPYFPDRARRSLKHYPGVSKGASAKWKGRTVWLDDNSQAQRAWSKYTGRRIARRSGYGVRHVWGEPWNPNAFTAGWNLCYMPFWVGMLTETQHPHPLVGRAIQQASWNLYFCENPVCPAPKFVSDPSLDLEKLLGEQPLRLLAKRL